MASSTDKLREFLRALLVSPEMLWLASVGLAAAFVPHWLLNAGSVFLSSDVPNILPVLGAPFAVLVAGFQLSGAVLRPHADRAVLRSWPDYWRLRLRMTIALGYALVGSLAVTAGWVIYKADHKLLGSSTSLAGVGVAAVAVASIAYAKQDVEDITDQLD